MIFIFHILAGVVIASKITFLPIAIFLALLSHYALDFLPHTEYSVKDIEKKDWKKSGLDFWKVAIDVGLGFAVVLIIHSIERISYTNIIIVTFFAVLPDILTILGWSFPNNKILQHHFSFHKMVHFPEDKKISDFWRFSSHIAVVIFFVILLII